MFTRPALGWGRGLRWGRSEARLTTPVTEWITLAWESVSSKHQDDGWKHTARPFIVPLSFLIEVKEVMCFLILIFFCHSNHVPSPLVPSPLVIIAHSDQSIVKIKRTFLEVFSKAFAWNFDGYHNTFSCTQPTFDFHVRKDFHLVCDHIDAIFFFFFKKIVIVYTSLFW